jgi:hypothetical protein
MYLLDVVASISDRIGISIFFFMSISSKELTYPSLHWVPGTASSGTNGEIINLVTHPIPGLRISNLHINTHTSSWLGD